MRPSEMTFTLGKNISAQTRSTWGGKTALEKDKKEIQKKKSAKPIGGKEGPLTSLSPNSIRFLFL